MTLHQKTRVVLGALAFGATLWCFDVSRAVAQEAYEPLNPKVAPIVFQVAAGAIIFENGKPVMGDSKVTKFSVGGHDIELVNNQLILEGGTYFVNTKKYGKMKVVIGAHFDAAVWATPSQRDELLKLAK
jgi:hypothetical protein